MQCDYFDAGLCRSCALMGQPYAQQLAAKQATVELLLAAQAGVEWLPPVASRESGFRTKAKMVVGGTMAAPTLGILDRAGRGVDLRECGVIAQGILASFPALIAFITAAKLEPYDVPTRRGELKHLIVTESPDGELMVRFVVRSERAADAVRGSLTLLQDALPQLAVATANILPEHKAVLEGEVEHVLTPRGALPMRVVGPGLSMRLELRPKSFFQTNTVVAGELYAQARSWVEEVAPRSLWDLYCGVGGFAIACAGSDAGAGAGARSGARSVLGVESSAEAVESARAAAAEAELDAVRFAVGDATAFALAAAPEEVPELVIVNPPRRGLGADLASWLERSAAQWVLYSSCNPSTLARDLMAMPSLAVRRGRLFDMFPQTGHAEVAVLLERVR